MHPGPQVPTLLAEGLPNQIGAAESRISPQVIAVNAARHLFKRERLHWRRLFAVRDAGLLYQGRYPPNI